MLPIVVVAGPTCSGKTDLAIKLAKAFNGFIINADSRQVYKDIPVATAQPKPDHVNSDGSWTIQGIKHYLFGFVPLSKEYNIKTFNRDVKKLLASKDLSNKLPILEGGSGLYIDSFINSYDLKHNQRSIYTRSYLNTLPLESLQKIAGSNLDTLNESDSKNRVRIIRLIEKGQKNDLKGAPIKHIYLLKDLPMELLEVRIKKRIDIMIKSGLEQEALGVLTKYDRKNLKGLNTIGMKEFVPYIKGEGSIEEVKSQIYFHTRQYAKRQKTWFKRNTIAIKVNTDKDAIKVVDSRLKGNS